MELPKFQQPLAQLNTLTEKWIYFLQHARDLSVVPPTMGDVAEIQQAFAIANRANLSEEELDELEHQSIFIQDQRGAITKATKQGIQQGRQEVQWEIARRLLGVMEDGAIAQTTGLSLTEIQALRQQETE